MKLARVGLLSIALVSIISMLAMPLNAKALSGAEFRPGNIIDDLVFTNKNSMTIQQIQDFLNARVPSCEIYHSAYNASNPPPYTCLKDYQENTTTGANNFGQFTNGVPNSIPGGKTAAMMIWDAAQIYSINPQVLIVLLQKEQGLVTDTWPLLSQFTKATGYLCPDTAACNSNAGGFSKQVFGAAWQFRNDFNGIDTPNFYSFYGKGLNNIRLSPDANCGTKSVNIENQATAVLYKYTPYTPNDAALNNLYGMGDNCSAYGNRNFWRYFNDWFGSSTRLDAAYIRNNVPVSIVAQPYATPAVGQKIDYTVSFKNNFSYQITLDGVGVVGRSGNMNSGVNRDFGWQPSITLPAGATQQFTFTTTVLDAGTIYVWPTIVYQGNYVQYNNWGTTITGHAANLSLSQPLAIDATTIYARQNVTFTTKIKNNEPFPISYDAMGIPVKYYDRYNYDAAWTGPGVIAAGAELTLSGTRNLDKPGPYSYWVSNYLAGSYSTVGSIKKLDTVEAAPNFSVSGVTLSNSTPVQGENLTASFTVTNNLPVPIDVDAVGVVGRFASFTGANRDIGWQGPAHFNAGETKTFSGYTRAITDVGTHYYWIGILNKGTYIQYNNWGRTIVSHAL
jgi:hypothetical protein